MNRDRTLIVIPARTASTRLARKLLLRETGKSVLQHTYENACRCELAERVVIAAGDPEIRDEAISFGAPYVMTDPAAASGTDRVAEVARTHDEYEIIVNLQADEPELAASSMDAAIAALQQDQDRRISTLAAPIRDAAALTDAACVKVVFTSSRRALYFSRSCIPFPRDGAPDLAADPPHYFQHIGLYAYRRDCVLQFSALPSSPLEQTEKLEQLRALAAGIPFHVVCVDRATRGIDTLDDYRAFVARAVYYPTTAHSALRAS